MSVLRNNRPPVTISLTAVFLININDFSFHRMKKKNIIIYVIAFIKCSKTDFSTWEGKKGLEGCSNMDVERNVILANWISMRNGGVTWRRNLRTHVCIFWNLNENCLFIHCRWSNWYLMWHLMQSLFFFSFCEFASHPFCKTASLSRHNYHPSYTCSTTSQCGKTRNIL